MGYGPASLAKDTTWLPAHMDRTRRMYERSKNHYLMHPETRALLEKLLKMVRDLGQDRTFAYMKFLLGCQKDY